MGTVGRLEFSPDGSTLFSEFQEEWNWSGTSHPSEEHYPPLWKENSDGSAGGFGPDTVQEPKGQFILTRRGEGIIEVFSLPEKRIFRRLVAFPPNTCLAAFSPRNNLMLATPPLGQAWIWNRKGPTRKFPGSVQDFIIRPCFSPLSIDTRSLAWSREGRWFALGQEGGIVLLGETKGLRLPDGRKADERKPEVPPSLGNLNAPVRSLAFGTHILGAISQRGQAALWRIEDRVLLKQWQAHNGRANTLQLDPRDQWCLTGGLDGIAIWNLPEVNLLKQDFADRQGVACLHLDPTGTLVAAAFLDGSIAVIQLPDLKLLWSAKAHTDVVSAVAFHPSGKWLVSIGWDKTLRAWKGITGQAISSREFTGATLAWSQDGKCLAVGGHECVTILDEHLNPLDGSSAKLDFRWDEDCT